MADAYVPVRNIASVKRGATGTTDLKSFVRVEWSPDIQELVARGGAANAPSSIDTFAGKPSCVVEFESMSDYFTIVQAAGANTKEKLVITYQEGGAAGATKTLEFLSGKWSSPERAPIRAKEDTGRVAIYKATFMVTEDEIGSGKALFGVAAGSGLINLY